MPTSFISRPVGSLKTARPSGNIRDTSWMSSQSGEVDSGLAPRTSTVNSTGPECTPVETNGTINGVPFLSPRIDACMAATGSAGGNGATTKSTTWPNALMMKAAD